MAAQENATTVPRRHVFANLDDAPQHLKAAAATRVAPVIAEIEKLRHELSMTVTQESRRAAAMALKNARSAAVTELRISIKAAKKKAAENACFKIENDSDLIVARIALLQFRDALQTAVAGPPINTVSVSTATEQQLEDASIVANEVICRIKVLLNEVATATDTASRQKAQADFRTVKEAAMKQLHCDRIAARAAFDVADKDDKVIRREDLIKARLVIELVTTEIKQFRNERKRKHQNHKEQRSAGSSGSNIAAEAEAVAAAAISTLQPFRDAMDIATDKKERKVARQEFKKARIAEMSRLHDARIAARNAVDSIDDTATKKELLPSLRLARQAIQVFKKNLNQVGMSAAT